MAVDASHLNLLPPPLINPNRDFAFSNQGINNNINNIMAYNNGHHQMGTGSGVPLVPAIAEALLPFHHQSMVCESVQQKISMNTDSGLTYNVAAAPRKRPRDSFDQFNNVPANFFCYLPAENNNDVVSEFPSLVGDRILPYIDEYQLDIDTIISQHTKKIRLELEERQKQHARILMAAIGEGAMKKLKDKDEQIQRMGKLNWALQERLKSLYVENQLWRDLAQTNEATANSLRNNLEQVLAHVTDERLSAGGRGGAGMAVEDDAESCCGSSDHDGNEREAEEETSAERRILRGGTCSRIAVEAQDKGAGG